jgi:KUP system potassium uptake protein
VLSLDSHGEGGTMALAAQIIESNAWPWLKSMALGASIVGTGFVLGDGCLTPAISVVSAIEGIAVYEESLVTAVVPISCIILFFLFMSQRFGTAKIGFLFGPIIVLWFLSIGAIGIWKQVGFQRRRWRTGVVGMESGACRQLFSRATARWLARARQRRVVDHRC